MPKEQLVLNQFEGGLMEYHDPRDIPENALSVATDVMVDKVGQIRLMGAQIPHKSIGNPNASASSEKLVYSDSTPGYGFHAFGSDYGITLNSGANLVTASTPSTNVVTMTNASANHNLSIGDQIYIEGSTFNGLYTVGTVPSRTTFTITESATRGANERFYWYRTTNDNNQSNFYATQEQEKIGVIDGWQIRDRIDLGTNSDNVLPAYYSVQDALRVSDGNFGNTGNSSKWYGYIPERTQFYKGHTETLGGSYWTENTSYNPGTLSSTSATGFDMDNGSGEQVVNSVDGSDGIELQDGVTIKLTFDLTLQSSHTINPVVYLTESINQSPSNSVSEIRLATGGAGSAQSNTIYLTPRVSSSTQGVINFYTNGDADYLIANLTITHVSYIPGQWYEETQSIAAPNGNTFIAINDDVALHDNNISTQNSTLQLYQVGLAEDTGVNNGQFMGADSPKFKVGMSYVYLGGQESKIFEDGTEIILTTNNAGLNACIQSCNYADSIDGSTFIDHRIIGARIYLTSQGSDTASLKSLDSPLLLIDIDNIKGARWWNGDWKPWAADGTNLHLAEVDLEHLEEYPIISYRALNGYEHDSDTLSAKWKTACIANNRVYAGNIFQADMDDQTIEYTSKQYGDRIIKSPYRKYDILPSDTAFHLNIVPGDGDEIITMLEFSNKLFVFKTKTLYIVNIAEDTEIIQSTHKGAGVSHPYSVTETPLGPAWVNSSGCYFYDGENVVNLIEKKIKPENWISHIKTNTGSIGYMHNTRQLLVGTDPSGMGDVTGSENNVYIYDFTTQSWTKGKDKMMADTARSNMQVSENNELIWLYSRPHDETVLIQNTTEAAGGFAAGGFGWNGGTLAAQLYLFAYIDADDDGVLTWQRISEEITPSGVTLTSGAHQVNAIQQAVNAIGGFTAQGTVGTLNS